MTAVDDILGQIPIDQLAAQLGTDSRTAEQAARQALPALLGGMGANARDPRGAASLAGAVRQHDPSLVQGGVNLADVDVVDGDKIVGNVFGTKRDAVVNTLSGPGSPGGGLVAKLLPLLAPIVMSYLAQQMSGRAGSSAGSSAGSAQGQAAGPDLGDLLGSMLGGGAAGGGGGSIGDLLGGLLGGGRR